MSLPVALRIEARAEFDEAFDWYEKQQPGLGVDFVARVQHAFDHISQTPQAHSPVFMDVRRAIVQRFPFAVYYRIEPDQVLVLSVFHSKRDPKVWRERAAE